MDSQEKIMVYNGPGVYVHRSQEFIEPFDRRRIVTSLIRETGLPVELAEKIALEVEEALKRMKLKFVSAPLIREIVNVKLLEHGLEEERKRYTRVGMPIYDVDKMILRRHWFSKENANLQHNPETVHKLIADQVVREYTFLKILPHEAVEAHMKGEIHIHTLEYFPLRPFCFSHDLRFFFKRGFIADGVGTHTAVAKPAKHPEVALLHATKVLAAAQTNCAGGQGHHNFNVFMAPYLEKCTYEQMKQVAQMMFYELGQMYVARGGQVVFSSVSLEPSIPKLYRDLPAVKPGGVVGPETYGDYEDVARRFMEAILEVALEGDAWGKPFNWPKLEIRLQKEWFKKCEHTYMLAMELTAKYGTPYFYNASLPFTGEATCVQCCRYIMRHDKWNDQEDLERGTLRGGDVQNVTINLPSCAYEVMGNDDKLFDEIYRRMEIAKKVLLIKMNEMKKRLVEGMLPFLAQPVDDKPYKVEYWRNGQLIRETLKGTPYFEPDKSGLSIGVLGLNEMLKAHTGYELHEPEGWRFGLRVIRFMREIVDKYTEETGYHFALVQSPAESAAHRLALIDLKRYGDKAVVQGDRRSGAVYYTNSTHVKPSAPVSLIERIKIEASFHPLFSGGVITHIWLGEATPNPQGLWRFTRRIAEKTLTVYFAFTKDHSVCRRCQSTHPGLLEVCPRCGADKSYIEWWSRITGYYQEVSGWNRGKIQELIERRRYQLV